MFIEIVLFKPMR